MADRTNRDIALDAVAEIECDRDTLGTAQLRDNEAFRPHYRRRAEPYVDALAEAGVLRAPLRVIETPEEADTLPVRSLIMDAPFPDGEMYQRTAEGDWAEPGFDAVLSSRGLAMPVTVLWEPPKEHDHG